MLGAWLAVSLKEELTWFSGDRKEAEPVEDAQAHVVN
jgi:hypothetical protein